MLKTRPFANVFHILRINLAQDISTGKALDTSFCVTGMEGHCMERAGTLLKQERLRQQKSLRDIADATKISITTLQAIEGDRVEFLPPPSYTRGFLKIYARELGLDPDEVLRLYEQEQLHQHRWGAQRELIDRGKGHGFQRLFAGCCLIVFCVVALVWFMSLKRTGPADKAAAPVQPVSTALPSSPSIVHPAQPPYLPQPVVEAPIPSPPPSMQSEQPAPEVEKTFTVRFVAHDLTWMRISSDNQTAFEILLRPGQTYTHEARSKLRARIGNPGGVSVFYNEQPVDLSGTRGRPVNVEFPPEIINPTP